MYLEHFGLSEAPFRITPHTDFFFDGADRGTTLDALLYAIQHDEGIVKVSGEVGSGKTMLCRVMIERLPEQVETIYLSNPALSRDDILFAIADDLQIESAGKRLTIVMREIQDRLIALYASGRRVVILIDEAHAMPEDTLEQVRLLSNLETNRHKLLQIVLFGQPELDAMLERDSLRQLRDRITQSFRMRPLAADEVGPYIAFRLRAAGYRGPDLFTPRAIALITRASDGLTRRINILADKALLSAFSNDQHQIDRKQVRAAIADAELSPLVKARKPLAYAALALVAGLLLGAAVQWLLTSGTGGDRVALWKGPVVRPETAVRPAGQAAVPTAPSSAPGSAAPAASTPPPGADATAGAPAGPAPAAANADNRSRPASAPGMASSVSLPVQGGSTLSSDAATAQTTSEAAARGPAEAAPPPIRHLDLEQRRRIAAYGTRGQKRLGERIAATREVLDYVSDQSYTLELYITENSDPVRMERFLERARDMVSLSTLYVIPVAAPGGYRMWVVYGVYESREAAEAAARQLPPKYQRAFRPSPRNFAMLRKAV